MRVFPVIAAVLAISAFKPTVGSPAPGPNDYADPQAWLCRPGRSDACAAALTATVITRDGAISKHGFAADPNAPIDCFYVYPTVSKQPTANADMTADPEETRVAKFQFARFGAKCRLYAPLYRQTTMAALEGKAYGGDFDLAYRDVLSAWTYYLAHDNQGRGVVLIGHSQGSRLLVRLIADQIDAKPVERLLVSAIVPGAAIGVPAGRDVGGRFSHIPLCGRADQFGCVIGYSSYLGAEPPGPEARFGGDPAPGQTDACVDPARLLGQTALQPELPATGALAAALGTTFIENPGLVQAACARTAEHSYLAISIDAGGALLQSRLAALADRSPGWGLHAIDMNLALGDLVELVGRQSAAWTRANPAASPSPVATQPLN